MPKVHGREWGVATFLAVGLVDEIRMYVAASTFSGCDLCAIGGLALSMMHGGADCIFFAISDGGKAWFSCRSHGAIGSQG